MSEISKRNWELFILFIMQLPAFHLSYALFPGDGYRIFTFLIVWALGWMTWFTITNKQAKNKWIYITLAFMIATTGQLLSWISFLFLLFHGSRGFL